MTNKGVEGLLKGLNPNKAFGPDKIPPRLLKELHHEIAPKFTEALYLQVLYLTIGKLHW